jgi:hypothetical protein
LRVWVIKVKIEKFKKELFFPDGKNIRRSQPELSKQINRGICTIPSTLRDSPKYEGRINTQYYKPNKLNRGKKKNESNLSIVLPS